MKKLFSVLIFLAAFFTVMLFGSVTASAESYSGSCGSSVSWSLDTETGVLDITGSGAMTNYSNTSSSIAPWYSYRSSVKTVNIGNSVTSIGDYAFYYCTGLTSVTIGNGVTSIGSNAFRGCTGLTSITIPDSVTSIGNDAFRGCSNLKYNTYDNANYLGNTDNPYLVLVKAKSKDITSCAINDKTRFIHSSAFDGCTGLTNITIPNSVTSIGEGAFYNCTGLTSITIPNSVTSIGEGAFYNCLKLLYNTYDNANYLGNTDNPYLVLVKAKSEYITSCAINDKARFIHDGAFYNCTGLTSITIPDSVTSIGSYAFAGCNGLTSIEIPNSVTSIGGYAFYNCTGLTSITIPDSVTSIGSSAFYNCTGLTEINFNAKSIDDFTSSSNIFYNAGTAGDGIKVTFGDSVEKIPAYLFYADDYSYRPKITSVTIGSSVTSIGDYAFEGCERLTSITIPDSVTSIGSSAFSGCTGLTSITIPDSVTSIGNYAFSGCPATIYGEFGSEAERYALANGIKFTELPEKIKIFYMPDKLTYSLNSELDLEGLIVAVYYPSGLLEWRYKGFEVSGFDTSAPGTKNVTIKYLGAAASFNIEVTGVIGDGNNDGKIDAEDLTVLTNALVSGAGYNESLDMNGDGKFDILDIVSLKKHLADNTVPLGKQDTPAKNAQTVPEVANLPQNKQTA